ncbi:MAG: baseplate J/gp47 family protein [Methanobacteriaceae archaeon]
MRLENDIVLEMSDGSTYSLSELIEESIDWWKNRVNQGFTKVDYFDEGSEAYNLTVFLNYLRLKDIQLAYDIKDKYDINYALGEDLDDIGLYYGILRNEGTFSTLTAQLALDEVAKETMTFYEGVEACTNDSIYFQNSDNIIIPIGEKTANFTMVAEDTGSFSNILEGTLVNIVSDLGVDATITNISPGIGGSDLEDDETYRARMITTKEFYPVWSVAWYTYLARTVSPRAKYVKTSNKSGDIYYITNHDELLDLFSIDKYNNVWINLSYIKANELVVYDNITLNVSAIKGYDTTQLVQDIITTIEDYINDSEIGGNIDKDYIVSLLYGVNGLNSLDPSVLTSISLDNNQHAALSSNFKVNVLGS